MLGYIILTSLLCYSFLLPGVHCQRSVTLKTYVKQGCLDTYSTGLLVNSAKSTLQCARQCYQGEDCYAFHYLDLAKQCYLTKCLQAQYIQTDCQTMEGDKVQTYTIKGIGTENNFLARGKTVTLSSYYNSIPTSVVVDGIYDPRGIFSTSESNYVIHTKAEPYPWMMIDLGTSHCIKGVTIWNRYVEESPETQARLHDVNIRVSNHSGIWIWCAYHESGNFRVHRMNCEHPINGHKVEVGIDSAEMSTLHIYEVEVIGN